MGMRTLNSSVTSNKQKGPPRAALSNFEIRVLSSRGCRSFPLSAPTKES